MDILRDRFPGDEGYFDLIYLDPPFNSNRSYNVIFKETNGVTESKAQVRAFEDYWQWTLEAKETLDFLIQETDQNTSDLMQALEKLIGHNDVLAYLVMMTVRLRELHRVLKPNGSIYLHCDPTASHYLKIVMDAIFGKFNFVNEIIWKRQSAHGDARQGASHLGRIHDVILFYSKTNKRRWNPQHTEYDESYIDNFYKEVEEGTGRRYMLDNITGPGGAAKGNPYYEFLGVSRYWRYSKETMEKLYKEGRIVQKKAGSVPRYKRYLDEMPGVELQDVWTDIKPVQSQSKERLGYPTQKPITLLERIINASSNKGDWILDPFCGCGTTVVAAEKLKRNWIGIDITALAINLIEDRIQRTFPDTSVDVIVDGIPRDLEAARSLFQKDPFEFEYWACHLINARPAKSKTRLKMRGSDRGIDGIVVFRDIDETTRKDIWRRAIVQIKGGKVGRMVVAQLRGDMERENSDMGVLVTLEEPTEPMLKEAVEAGVYHHNFNGLDYPKIQIITIKQLLGGADLNMPKMDQILYHKEAKAALKGTQIELL